VELLTEDRSGGVVLAALTESIISSVIDDYSIEIRPSRGCGQWPENPYAQPEPFASGLLDLLPAKLRAYDKVYAGTETILIICMDSDDHDQSELFSRLRNTCRRFAPHIRTIIALCVEEIESWLLGDEKAILKAYPDADLAALREYDQDSICGTWEVLCHVVMKERAPRLIRVGYPAIGQYKKTWAEDISRYMRPENNVSPSFVRFYQSLLRAITIAKEDQAI